MGPDYHRPDTPVDASFANAGEVGFEQNEAAQAYWTAFNDAQLNTLIDEAVAHNNDLKVAAANLRQSRAAKRLAGFDLFPTVTLAGGYTRALVSQQQFPEIGGIPESARHVDSADAEFDGLWELDLFGRVRRNLEAARADVGGVMAVLRGCTREHHCRGGAQLSRAARVAGSAGADQAQCRQPDADR